ncbi:SnoaL/DnrD family polyketide biosynthesis methyl ester cyclase [Streptomyces sp. NPDC020801]|uniref:SnoaL/DnrD family polyketide biosynthesis methyl ester cyclase n=1 Tax=unclassified Streptomyces TaxID=2593676 RepID=UPI00379CDE12
MTSQLDAARRMIRAFNTGETDDAQEYIHEEYLNPAVLEHGITQGGPSAFAMMVAWVRATFSDQARLEEVRLEENGEWVRAHLVLYGHHVGPLVGMAPTGRPFAGEQIHLLRFVDEKIRDHRDWPDFQSTYRQLGEPWPQAGGWRP